MKSLSCGTLAVLFSLSVAGCVPPTPGGAPVSGGVPVGGVPPNLPSLVGTLEVSGTEVFVNGTPARSGEAIYDGNKVTTGAGSSALVNLDGGGSVQLDENTDPLFKFQLFREGWCLVINIASGQLFDDTHGGRCVEIKTPDGSGVAASRVNVQVGSAGTSWTVLQGAVRLARPAGTVVHAFERVTVSKGKIVETSRLSADELARITAWRAKYRLRPGPIAVPPFPPAISPGRVARPRRPPGAAVPSPVPSPAPTPPAAGIIGRRRPPTGVIAVPTATPTPPPIR